MDAYIARYALSSLAGPVVRRHFARRFTGRAPLRVALYYNPTRISFSQAYPFLHYAPHLRRRFGAEVRAIPIERLFAGAAPDHGAADVILVQPWFTVDPETLKRAIAQLRRASPAAEISFLDSYAHADLRLARHVAPEIRHYLKKSRFRDRSLYLRPWKGDTNLTEYYGALYGIEADPVDWQTPPALLDRVRLTPNFLTDPRFMPVFARSRMPPREGRTIDLHARLGRRGSGWYGTMRGAAIDRLARLGDLRVAAEGSVPLKEFLRELAASKLCFSPFGYGEVCWRDIEAIQAGSVMIKPDMSHLETLPDLYEAGVTYLPCRWDFADLEEVVRGALADEDRSARIAAEAWRRASDYIRQDRFVADIGFLFGGAP